MKLEYFKRRITYLQSAATPFTKKTAYGPCSGLSNEIPCILAGQGLSKLPEAKVWGLKRFHYEWQFCSPLSCLISKEPVRYFFFIEKYPHFHSSSLFGGCYFFPGILRTWVTQFQIAFQRGTTKPLEWAEIWKNFKISNLIFQFFS